MKSTPAMIPQRPALRAIMHALVLTALVCFSSLSASAAATFTQKIDPPEITLGNTTTVTISIQGAEANDFQLPEVDGLNVISTGVNTSISLINGAFSTTASRTFEIGASHAGSYTIPAFDIGLQDGSTLHIKAMKLNVVPAASASSVPGLPAQNSPPSPPPNLAPYPVFNPNGPVVMPPKVPVGPTPPDASATTTPSEVNPPLEPDGRPAKVFIVIAPETTDAYVGESIPMRIDFYLRLDVAAQQDSLPTIKGSDFLINSLTGRYQEEQLEVANEPYIRDTWITAISAPKSGDFPLQMVRDTYWVKRVRVNFTPLSNFFMTQPTLEHEPISSNQLTIHVHSLPDEGRPAHFTGVIGQLKVTGTAQPLTVAVGEPVTLNFTITGSGNFDYIRCPVLAEDPAWKSYVPSSKIDYQDNTHTQGVKTFTQAVIPQKSGNLPLPQATFSYFDPSTKQYVTIPISLPGVTVTGSALATTASPAAPGDSEAANPASAAEFLPNRVTMGHLYSTLLPVYHQPWFWLTQGGLLLALALGLLVMFIASRRKKVDDSGERLQQQLSLKQEQEAMAKAVSDGNALNFFVAARHAIQLQLGAQWRVNPEALTLGEIRSRDASLAESLEPLFTQADEVIYSGGTGGRFDLAHWERHVRELLQPHLQTA